MSRIGRLPIDIPSGVDIKLEDENFVTVTGPKGTLNRKLVKDMNIAINEGQVNVTRPSESVRHRSLHGLTRTLIYNMVVGVTEGYSKTLEIQGVGYRAAKDGNVLKLTLGYSHPVELTDPEGVTATVEGNNKIIISGIDKEVVGQYAAEIRAKRKPEPYKGKGIRYSDERVRRKAGKTGKS